MSKLIVFRWLLITSLFVTLVCGTACGDKDGVRNVEPHPQAPAVYYDTPEALQAALDGFNWADTKPWPTKDPSGGPAWYYAEILARRNDGSINEFTALELTWDFLPLFPDEEFLWMNPNDPSTVNMPFIPAGQMVYIIVPSEFFNEVRMLTLVEGENIYSLMRQRTAPASWRNKDGSLNTQRLAEAGLIP